MGTIVDTSKIVSRMDQWLQKLSFILILLLAALTYTATRAGTKCLTPAEFTRPPKDFAHAICSLDSTLKHIYSVDEEPGPPSNVSTWTSPLRERLNHFWILLLGEMVVVCVTYTVLTCLQKLVFLDAKSPNKALYCTYYKIPIYLLMQFISCACWFSFVVQSRLKYFDHESDSDALQYLCIYRIRLLSNDHLNFALLANIGLGVSILLSKALHFVLTFVIGPYLSVTSARTILVKQGVMSSPEQLRIAGGFGFSDLYFALLAGLAENNSFKDEAKEESTQI